MADADTLLEEYIAAYAAGKDPDPVEWIARADEAERPKVAALIDAYLARAPTREWDPEAFRASGLATFAEQITTSLFADAGTWPVVLPQLREKAQIKRKELVARLAAMLGAESKQEKVGAYYHQMEQGSLPPAGVSDTVLEALGTILGQSAHALRKAGQSLGPAAGEAPAPAPAFARSGVSQSVDSAVEGRLDESAGEWDEVDRLFRGN